MKLENWYIIDNQDGYTAPELVTKHACGNVYGNPLHKDGKHVKTSSLVKINLEEKYVITFSGSRYDLGNPDPNYAAIYGDFL